ncbi:MAG: phage baseplate assembly protein V [Synergistaceae bacterium]|nr:phage baseplate assembly protein V [Synergistaceae bacterium]
MQDIQRNEPGVRARFGYVSAWDPARHMARVRFPDKSDRVSAWLPVALPNTRRNKDEMHLDIDEHVLCLMMGNGLEMGIVMCAFYDDKNPPLIGDEDTRAVTFDDGTRVSYDRKHHALAIEAPEPLASVSVALTGDPGGSVTVSVTGEDGAVTIDAPRIVLRGAVECPGYCRCG